MHASEACMKMGERIGLAIQWGDVSISSLFSHREEYDH